MRDRSPADFISRHEFFTLDEFRAAYASLGRDPSGAHNNLAYHVRVGNLFSLGRGVYARPGAVDDVLLASKLVDDAIISHEGALEHFGLIEVEHQLSFLTRRRVAPLVYSEVVFKPMQVSAARYARHRCITVTRSDSRLRVSTLEQALVDCLEDLDRAPGTALELLDLFRQSRAASPREMIELAIVRKSPLLASRVGFFLQSTRRDVDDDDLRRLERKALKAPDYFRRRHRPKNGRIVPRWNLIVPRELAAEWRRSQR